jgi:hypothetical protein
VSIIDIFVEIFVGVTVAILSAVIAKFSAKWEDAQKHQNEIDEQARLDLLAIKCGLQAMLRNVLVRAFNFYVIGHRYIPMYEKESLLVCADSYESLYKNGVMQPIIDAIRKCKVAPEDVPKTN